MAKSQSSKASVVPKKDIPVAWENPENLLFDTENPRLAEHGITSSTPQKEILHLLWELFAVDELVMSIASTGYISHEPLIATKEGRKNIVIEGNRRLAAIKIIKDPRLADELGASSLFKTSKALRDGLDDIPVIYSTRLDAWRYLGFKHVNGPARWDSYAKAQYIASIHNDHGVPLSTVAQQIGDRHKTVSRLFRGLMVMNQAEKAKVYNREWRAPKRFSFYHLYTGLDYEGFTSFLGIKDGDPDSPSPVPKAKLENLGELLIWLYGDKRGGSVRNPVIRTQAEDLKRLNQVLLSPEALNSLRKGASLDYALDLSRDPNDKFRSSLLDSKEALQTARALMTEGYKGEPSLLETARIVADLGADLLEDMERRNLTVTRARRRSK